MRQKRLQFFSLIVRPTFCTQLFEMLSYTTTVSNFTTQMKSFCTSLSFPTTSKDSSLKTREFFSARATIMKIFLMRLRKHLCAIPFTRRLKVPSRPGGFLLYGRLWVGFSSTSGLLYPNRRTGYV